MSAGCAARGLGSVRARAPLSAVRAGALPALDRRVGYDARDFCGEAAFLVRTLLIHEYRKIHLQDPLLPAKLLPADWIGTRAYELTRRIYAAVFATAEGYLSASARRLRAPLPPAAATPPWRALAAWARGGAAGASARAGIDHAFCLPDRALERPGRLNRHGRGDPLPAP